MPAKLVDATHRMLQYWRAGRLTGKRVLFYGAGVAPFAAMARLLGFSASAIDPFYDPGKGGAERYDLIVCLHALEHTMEAGRMFDELRQLASPTGTVILTVANAASPSAGRLGTIPQQRFTEEGIHALARRHQFEVINKEYLERWDANALADDKLSWLFSAFERKKQRGASRWLLAQLTASARFLTFAGTYFWPNVPVKQRAEIVFVLRALGSKPW
jgi:hypothetical protein